MSLDAYNTCPCGSGKKLKFCCSKDILHDLEKVIRAVAGDQRAAALDTINRLISEKGARPALLALKAEVLLSMGNAEEAAESNAQLLEAMPHSPPGLGVQTIIECVKGNLDGAVERLQEALELTDEEMFRSVLAAIEMVANVMLQVGLPMAARGHFALHAQYDDSESPRSLDMLLRMSSAPQMPLLFRQDLRLMTVPSDAPWQGEFNAAMKSAGRGAWRAACEILESLDQKAPGQPAVWHNIAVFRTWLGQTEQAVQAWRKYGSLPDVPTDTAVEAEAMALLLDASAEDMIDVVKLTYEITETDKLMEMLLSDKRANPTDASEEYRELNEIPPKGSFIIFDRQMPQFDDIQSFNELPIVIGEVHVFGRQTDREARLEMTLTKTSRFEEHKAELFRRFEGLLGKFVSEDVLDQVNLLQAETAINRPFPGGSDRERVQQMVQDYRRDVYFNQWPNVPLTLLDGKTIREAAAVPELQKRVLALVLNLELASADAAGFDFDFNELRRELGLPEQGFAEIPEGGLGNLSVAALGRLDYSKLSDDELVTVFTLLGMAAYRSAMLRAGEELVSRPAVAEQGRAAGIYRSMATLTRDSDKALNYIAKGRQFASSEGDEASWYLLELQVRFARFEGAEVNRIIQLITSRYSNNSAVMQQLYSILVHFGVLNPDGSPVGRHEERAPEAAAAAPAGGLWTPESAAAPKQESKLWLPGQD